MHPLDLLRPTRRRFAELLALPREALVRVPPGFRNNILWNVGHALVSQQLMCYARAGLPLSIPLDLIDGLRRGTDPTAWERAPDPEQIAPLLCSTIDRLAQDLQWHRFTRYEPFETSFGVRLTCIEDAIAFDMVHEALHLGVCMALRRAVGA